MTASRAPTFALFSILVLFATPARAQTGQDWFKAKARGAGETYHNSGHGDDGGGGGGGGGSGGRGGGGSSKAPVGDVYDDDDTEYDAQLGDMDPDKNAIRDTPKDATPKKKKNGPPKSKTALLIKGQKKTLSARCDNREVTVIGQMNKVELKGTCRVLVVTGSGHDVTVDVVDMISVEGSDNRITYGSGPDGGRPRIAQTGKKNVVQKAVAVPPVR